MKVLSFLPSEMIVPSCRTSSKCNHFQYGKKFCFPPLFSGYLVPKKLFYFLLDSPIQSVSCVIEHEKPPNLNTTIKQLKTNNKKELGNNQALFNQRYFIFE